MVGPQGAGVVRRGGIPLPSLSGVPVPNCGAHPVPSAPARLHLPDLESTSTTPGRLGGGGLPQAVQGAPSPAGQPPWGDSLGLSLQTFSSLGSPRLSSTAYVKGFAFPNGPSSPQGCEEERW